MDDIVKQAMAKWPNVPDVYGWLSLSRRGEWRIKGEKISNPIVTDFINRNYTHDDQGRWFFQNGPQRVFVLLDYTPLVYRLANSSQIETHTGHRVDHFIGAYIDDSGSLLLHSAFGIGVVDDRDLDKFLNLFTDAQGHPITEAMFDTLANSTPTHWQGLRLKVGVSSLMVETIPAYEIPTRFHVNASPKQPPGDEECY
jgi:Protein of unknown function (DUF2946)